MKNVEIITCEVLLLLLYKQNMKFNHISIYLEKKKRPNLLNIFVMLYPYRILYN